MKNSVRTTLALLALTMAAGVSTTNALAGDTPWQQRHPRREEVNKRLHTQNKRITREVKEGDMTHAQAHQLRASDRSVRAQERLMAKQNGGSITKAEDRALNQELNKNSKAIGQ